jgi:hypothetical protein
MSKYYLTEAYGELYNPRRADETFYENLRFVDYLMQEEIEEVMESLLWEFMDYGNTLDESHSLIESVFSDSVILEGVLMELNPYAPAGSKEARQYARATTRSKRGAERAAAVTGALKKAKETVGKAATGALETGKKAAAGAYERAKGLPGKAMVALKGVVRKGATAAGRKIEKSGEKARKKAQIDAAGADYSSSARSSGGYSVVAASKARTAGIKAASKTGSKRRAIGRYLRKVGAMVGRAGKGSSENKSRMTRDDLRANNARRADAARQAVGDPFSSTSSGRSTPERKYPIEKSGQITLFDKPVPGKSAGADVKVPSGGQRKFGATRKPKGGSGKRQLPLNLRGAGYSETQRESVDFELLAQYILEDFIAEGYANNYEDALEILENLSEESILELTEMYLEG